MEKLVLLVKYKTKPHKREVFVDEVTASGVLEKIRKEAGFVSYDYYFDAADSDSLLLVEEWQSEEQQKQHLQTKHMEILKNIKEKYVLETSIRKIMYDCI